MRPQNLSGRWPSIHSLNYFVSAFMQGKSQLAYDDSNRSHYAEPQSLFPRRASHLTNEVDESSGSSTC